MLEPKERIRFAFLQLEFSIKLFCHFERGEVDKDSFDRQTTIRLPGGDLSFPHSAFHTYRDLVLASQNVYSTTLGLSAVALDTALSDGGIRNDPTDLSERGQLRSFIYMVRCAFAHDLMHPKWEARGQYARTYQLNLGAHSLSVDMAALNGRPLELEDFGGMLSYLAMKDAVLAWLP